MSEERLTCYARVQLTIELELTQPWSHDETLKNLYSQAKDQAVRMTDSAVSKFGRVVGDIKVTALLVPSDGRR